MKTKSPSVENWEEEFQVFYEYDEKEWLESRDKVKDFIRSLLTQSRQELREELTDKSYESIKEAEDYKHHEWLCNILHILKGEK